MIPRLFGITPGDGRDLRPYAASLASLPAWIVREREVDEGLLDGIRGLVVLHDRMPGARAVARERGLGLHLPSGGDVASVRHLTIVGVSCHSSADVDVAFSAGADYVLLSPVWSPASKPDDNRPTLGLGAYLSIAGDRPVLALGGVSPARLRALRERGGYGAAVLGGLFDSEDPASSLVAYQKT